MSSSVTVTTSSTSLLTCAKVSSPGRPTAMPSAIVRYRADAYRPPGRQRRREGGGAGRLYADHPDVRAQRLDHDRDAGDQPAAADAGDDGPHLRALLEDLQRHRALPGDHVRMVERVDEHRPGTLGELLRPPAARRPRCRRPAAPVAPYPLVAATFGSGAPTGMNTVWPRPAGWPPARRPGRGCRRWPRPPHGPARSAREPGDPHVRAAHLVGAGALDVLALEPGRAAELGGQRPARLQRGQPYHVGEQLPGGLARPPASPDRSSPDPRIPVTRRPAGRPRPLPTGRWWRRAGQWRSALRCAAAGTARGSRAPRPGGTGAGRYRAAGRQWSGARRQDAPGAPRAAERRDSRRQRGTEAGRHRAAGAAGREPGARTAGPHRGSRAAGQPAAARHRGRAAPEPGGTGQPGGRRERATARPGTPGPPGGAASAGGRRRRAGVAGSVAQPGGGLLELAGDGQQEQLRAGRADQLDGDRQAVRADPDGHHHGRQAGDVPRRGVGREPDAGQQVRRQDRAGPARRPPAGCRPAPG